MSWLCRACLFTPALHFVDDFGSCEDDQLATSSFDCSKRLCRALGFSFKQSKEQPPASTQLIQGLDISVHDDYIMYGTESPTVAADEAAGSAHGGAIGAVHSKVLRTTQGGPWPSSSSLFPSSCGASSVRSASSLSVPTSIRHASPSSSELLSGVEGTGGMGRCGAGATLMWNSRSGAVMSK